MQNIKLLQEQIDALKARITAIENALQIDARPDPDDTQHDDPNREAARKKYNAATEEEKRIAQHIHPAIIKESIAACKTQFDFIYISELYTCYSKLCKQKRLTPIFKKYFIVALSRDGYPIYNYYGAPCVWISDKPKPRPGKRPKKQANKTE